MQSDGRLIILTPGFPASEEDTVTIPSLQLFLRTLSGHAPGLPVTVLTFQYPFNRGSYRWHGMNIWSAGGSNGKLNRIVTWMRIMRKLSEIRKQEGIVMIHAFWLTETTLLGLLYSRLFRIPFLATAMGQDVKPSNRYLYLLRFFWFRIVLLSRFQQHFPGKRINRMVKAVIPFGVDLSCFPPATFSRDIDILGVGSLNETKNYPEFVRIIAMVSAVRPDVRCVIVGADTGQGKIRRIIEQSPASQRIRLMGELPYRQVLETMSRSRILLHCAPFEGQALVITEALAAGMHVVCRPAGISADLKCEHLHTATESSLLAERILRLLENTRLDQTPVVGLTMGDTCSRYLELYHLSHDHAS